MFRGSLILLVIFSFSMAGSSAFAQAQAPSAKPKSKAKPVANRNSNSLSKTGVGLGYLMFSESLRANDSTQIENGIGNYVGLTVYVDQSWTRGRWIYGGSAGFGSGKATAGGFSAISYPDAGKRTWTLAYLEAAGHYRITSTIAVGAGFLGGSRSADWKSSINGQLQVKGINKVIYAPEYLMRWSPTRRLTLVQSIATPDFRGTTMWRWTAHYNL